MEILQLAWDTFDFLTEQIAEHEAKYIETINLINNHLNAKSQPTLQQRARLKDKLFLVSNKLLVLYAKHLSAINDLVELNDQLIDIPIHFEVDSKSLIGLKDVTQDLIKETNKTKDQYFRILS